MPSIKRGKEKTKMYSFKPIIDKYYMPSKAARVIDIYMHCFINTRPFNRLSDQNTK